MNSYERVMAALRGQIPDRVPILEWFVHHKVYQALVPGSSWPDFVEQIGLDGISALFLYEGTFAETPLDEKTVINEWGVTLGITEEHKAPIDGPIKSLTDARRYMPPDPNAAHRLGNLPQYVQRFKGEKAVIWCQRAEFMWAADLRRLDNLLMDFIDNPQLAHQVLEIVNEFAVALARRAVRAGADVVMLGDDYAYNSGPMMSPAMFKEFIQPRLARVVEVIHEEGALCVKHSDGNLWSILDMIVDTGVDAINPMEPAAGMDITDVKRRYGERVCLIGNIDCGELLSNRTIDDVIRTVRQTIEQAAPGGAYIMSSSNTIHSSVKPENYQAMIEATHRYGSYISPEPAEANG
ncbi:MAG: uroporphyrinogen decarboxylase family protein [Anaerolineales bacterium]